MNHYYKTFVSVGNPTQGFSRLLNAVIDNIDLLPKPVLIQHGSTQFKYDGCSVVDFIAMDDFISCVKNAELLIFHAGAGSVLNTIRVNKLPIVMARRAIHNEMINDHQVAFAEKLEKLGKVRNTNDSASLKKAIEETLKNGIFLNQENNNSKGLEIIRGKVQEVLGSA